MSAVKKYNRYVVYSKDSNNKKVKTFVGVGISVKPVVRKGELNYRVKGKNINKLYSVQDYGLQIIPAGQIKPTTRKFYNPKRKVKFMPKGKGKGPGRPKKRGRPKSKPKQLTPKQRIMVKAKASKRKTMSQIQQEQRMVSKKAPTRTINMHGSLYTLYDEKARIKSEAQKVRQKLKAQGKAAFINPRKRKAGTQWFIYQKARVKVSIKSSKIKVSKRTGVPAGSINMHGRKYNLYDDKPRSKSAAQTVRKRLVNAGKSAFLNPRKRKSGIEYFVYTKQAERRRKSTSPKIASPRRSAYKTSSKKMKELEAELRRLKRDD